MMMVILMLMILVMMRRGGEFVGAGKNVVIAGSLWSIACSSLFSALVRKISFPDTTFFSDVLKIILLHSIFSFPVTFGMTSQTHYYYTKVMTDLFYELPEVGPITTVTTR